ncbi:hypothetical protein ACFL4U_02410 [Candidatus Neomarinimicrobiota bacterium]
MNLKNLFLINAIIALFFGAVFVLMPEDTLAQYGVKLVPKGAILVARLFGSALLGLAIITWFARSFSRDVQQDIILGLFVLDGVGFVVTLLAQLDGAVNSLGWTTVAIYLLLTLGFGYFRFLKTKG